MAGLLLRDMTAFPQRIEAGCAMFHVPPSADGSGSVRDPKDGVNEWQGGLSQGGRSSRQNCWQQTLTWSSARFGHIDRSVGGADSTSARRVSSATSRLSRMAASSSVDEFRAAGSRLRKGWNVRQASSGASPTTNGGFEAKLWATADALRNNMDAAEYKHVVLGLIFLKYISDAFEAKHAELEADRAQGGEPEYPDEYRAVSIFWVPKEARWQHLKASAPQPTIGTLVDDAMTAIERDNPTLKGVLPKDYARPGLDKQRLGQLINLVSDIALGAPADRAKDTLGRVYEYFLAQFASAEGKKGGQFYTPSHVVRILVEMLAPYKGRVYDPCCGSGGMFVSSEKFIEAHAGRLGDISIYGQDRTTPRGAWRR